MTTDNFKNKIQALIGFMPTPGQGTIGAVEYPPGKFHYGFVKNLQLSIFIIR